MTKEWDLKDYIGGRWIVNCNFILISCWFVVMYGLMIYLTGLWHECKFSFMLRLWVQESFCSFCLCIGMCYSAEEKLSGEDRMACQVRFYINYQVLNAAESEHTIWSNILTWPGLVRKVTCSSHCMCHRPVVTCVVVRPLNIPRYMGQSLNLPLMSL